MTKGFVKNGGVKIFYVKKGEGKQTILFVHGFPLDHTIFDCQVKYFSEFYTTVTIDRRGNGLSSIGAHLDYGLNAQVSDIVAVIKKLKLESVTLVGHSVGSVYVLATAALYPELIRKVVTLGGFPAVFKKPDFPIGLPDNAFDSLVNLIPTDFPAFIRGFVNKATTDLCDSKDLAKLQDQYTKHFIEVSDRDSTLASFEAFRPLDIVNLLDKIECPVLLTYGTQDQIIPPDFSIFLRQNLPKSYLLEFINKGHLLMATDFCRFNHELRDFVDHKMFKCKICLSKNSKCHCTCN
jgi:non-heme chloroperoxidase